MEKKELDILVRRLWMEYVAVWLLTAGVVLLYETGILSEGALAHDGQICYMVQTLVVLLTLCLIPVSLKMYRVTLDKLLKELKRLSPREVMVRYRRLNEVRLALLAVVALTGMSVYYVTLSSIGGFCSLLSLTATLFCLPTRKQVEMDLMEEDEETDSHHSQL